MNSIVSLGMDDLIRNFSKEKPILGVCVGMQLLFQESDWAHTNEKVSNSHSQTEVYTSNARRVD